MLFGKFRNGAGSKLVIDGLILLSPKIRAPVREIFHILPLRPQQSAGVSLLSRHDILYQLRPALWITAQQLLVLQVLLVNNWVCKVPFIAFAVFLVHFERIENMDLCSRNVDLVR